MARRPPRRPLAPALFAFLALTGCSFSVGTKEVSETEVEEQAETQLAAQVPNQPRPNVDCPDALKAEVGAKLECVLTVTGDTDRYPVTIEVKSVEGDTANFDVKVGDAPIP